MQCLGIKVNLWFIDYVFQPSKSDLDGNQSIESTDCFCVERVLHKTLYIKTGEKKRIFVT